MTNLIELQMQRCDSCGVRGIVFVELVNGMDLMFCGHHFDKNAAALGELILNVEDERVPAAEVAAVVV